MNADRYQKILSNIFMMRAVTYLFMYDFGFESTVISLMFLCVISVR